VQVMEEAPPTLRVLWPEFEQKAWGYLTTRESGLALAAGIGIWIAWASTGPVVRPSTALLGLCVAIAAAYGAVELLHWRHWRAWWLFRWVYREQARLDATSGGTHKVTIRELDRLMSDAVPGSGVWPDIRSLAAPLDPAPRENLLLLADIVEGRSHDSTKLRSAVAQLADAEERRYWTARLAITEAFAAYAAGADYMRPLVDAAAKIGRRPLFWIAVLLRRFSLTWIWLGVGIALALVLIVVWGA